MGVKRRYNVKVDVCAAAADDDVLLTPPLPQTVWTVTPVSQFFLPLDRFSAAEE